MMVEANRNDTDENLEANEETVDPRLDNRTGRRRPPLETFPAKPQQIDGPSLAESVSVKEALRAEEKDTVVRKGMASPGPHGLGDTEVVPFDEAVENPEKSVTADDRAKAASDTAKTTAPKPANSNAEKKEAK